MAYGFEVRSVGHNRNAAQYSGIKVGWIMASTMAVAGMLAGLGGAVESLGVDGRFEAGVNVGLGFEGITIALLLVRTPGVISRSVAGWADGSRCLSYAIQGRSRTRTH